MPRAIKWFDASDIDLLESVLDLVPDLDIIAYATK